MNPRHLLTAAVFAACPLIASAEPAAVLTIELNKTEQLGADCQAFLMMENGTESRLDRLGLDLVMIDRDGVIARRLAVEVGPLRAGRTSVKVFAIDGIDCGAIGRVLLNDVLACEDAAGPRDDCLELIRTTARGPIAFAG
ncbi:MAG: Tat pathway signal sequence domain protein [Geminicoccaceae bacterium]